MGLSTAKVERGVCVLSHAAFSIIEPQGNFISSGSISISISESIS